MAKTDWGRFFGNSKSEKIQREKLIADCQRHGIPINTTNSNIPKMLQGEIQNIASDDQLWWRIQTYKSKEHAQRANIISLLALMVSLIALIASFLKG